MDGWIFSSIFRFLHLTNRNKIGQSWLKNYPNAKQTLQILPKTFRFLPKRWNFTKSGHAEHSDWMWYSCWISVTIFGDLLHFGLLFKVCGSNYLAQIAHILRQFLKGVKIFHFLVKLFLGNFYWHLATFTGHTVDNLQWPTNMKVRNVVFW